MKRLLIALPIIIMLAFTNTIAVDLYGTVSGTLNLENSPYNVIADIFVPSESTLLIEPGVTMNFRGTTRMFVGYDAILTAIGTENDSIRFTCDTLPNGKWDGILIDTSSTVSILRYCIIESSECGAVFCRHSSPEITNCTIRYCNNSNHNRETFAFGISCVINSNANVSENVFQGNWGSDGALAANYYSYPNFENNLFIDNYASNGAVGIVASFGARASIKGNVIDENSGFNSYAICILGPNDSEISGNIISNNNLSGSLSGAIYCGLLNGINILGNTIMNNIIGGSANAGLLQFYNAFGADVKYNLIINNYCTLAPIFSGQSNLNVMVNNNTIYGNDCGAISQLLRSGLISGHNNIIWNNSNTLFGDYIWLFDSDVSGHPGMGMDIDPLFRNPEAGDFHLQSIACGDPGNSPCIDTGNSSMFQDSLGCDYGLGSSLPDLGAFGGQISLPCSYIPGDVNFSGSANGSDVTFFVNFLKGGPTPPYSCECEGSQTDFLAADVNGSCDLNGIDISYFVNFLKGLGPAPRRCPSCPSAQ